MHCILFQRRDHLANTSDEITLLTLELGSGSLSRFHYTFHCDYYRISNSIVTFQYKLRSCKSREPEEIFSLFLNPVLSLLTEMAVFTSCFSKVYEKHKATLVCQWHLPFLTQTPQFTVPRAFSRSNSVIFPNISKSNAKVIPSSIAFILFRAYSFSSIALKSVGKPNVQAPTQTQSCTKKRADKFTLRMTADKDTRRSIITISTN